MFLPQTAEYALRAMAQIAVSPTDEPIRTQDLAEKTHVPLQYLLKIMRRLVVEGLLVSEKGRSGGFRLARPLKRIRFVDILKAVGFESEPNHCAFGWGECNPKKPCVLHSSYKALNAGFKQWAEKTTLADVASGQARLTWP